MRRRCCRPPRLAQPDLGLEDGDRRPREGGTPSPPDPAATTADHAAGRRYLALVLPRLAVDRLRRQRAAPPEDVPLVVWARRGARRLAVAVDAAGRAAELREGQPLADAQAIRPDLVAVEEDPEADLAFLRRLALWALRFTPLSAMDPPDALLLDVTGAAHLFGGEAALLRTAIARLRRAGLEARGAVAGAPAAAAALARAGHNGLVVPPGGEAAAVDALPLSALPAMAPEVAAALRRLGLWRIGQVRRQPRGPLARRFGAELLDLLDAAAGLRPTPIAPVRPPPEMEVAQEFLEPLITREAIDTAVSALLRGLCRRLERAGRGARRVALLAHRVDGDVQEIAIGTGTATRDPAHLGRLFAERLDRLAPGFGFDRIALSALRTEAMAGTQGGFAGTGASPPDRQEALAQLLDRLSQRLPVWRLAPRASHWPERQVARVGAFEAVAVPEGWPGRIPRPVLLLRRPLELSAIALLPDAPPSSLRIGAAWHRVRRAEGPERLSAEWWRPNAPEGPEDQRFRDYYRVELESGVRLWVCRVGFARPGEATARWYLHGRCA